MFHHHNSVQFYGRLSRTECTDIGFQKPFPIHSIGNMFQKPIPIVDTLAAWTTLNALKVATFALSELLTPHITLTAISVPVYTADVHFYINPHCVFRDRYGLLIS